MVRVGKLHDTNGASGGADTVGRRHEAAVAVVTPDQLRGLVARDHLVKKQILRKAIRQVNKWNNPGCSEATTTASETGRPG